MRIIAAAISCAAYLRSMSKGRLAQSVSSCDSGLAGAYNPSLGELSLRERIVRVLESFLNVMGNKGVEELHRVICWTGLLCAGFVVAVLSL